MLCPAEDLSGNACLRKVGILEAANGLIEEEKLIIGRILVRKKGVEELTEWLNDRRESVVVHETPSGRSLWYEFADAKAELEFKVRWG